MPTNIAGGIGALGAIGVAAVLHLFAPNCPLGGNSDAVASSSFVDPAWGTVNGLALVPTAEGSEFTATADVARHRTIERVSVPSAGTYRVALDTRYLNEHYFQIEVGGGDQTVYGTMIGDLRNGEIVQKSGDLRATSSASLAPGDSRYHWSLDLDLAAGAVYVNIALLASDRRVEFPGSSACSAVFSEPSVRPAVATAPGDESAP